MSNDGNIIYENEDLNITYLLLIKDPFFVFLCKYSDKHYVKNRAVEEWLKKDKNKNFYATSELEITML